MKVVGVGLNKTGTKTLRACLAQWGLKSLSHDPESIELYRKGDYEEIMKRVAQYDCFEDWPWPLLYEEIDQNFPGSKFILTRRKSADVWFASYYRMTIAKIGKELPNFEKEAYGYAKPHGRKKRHINVYNNHLETVRDYFRDRSDDFLEVCWEEGDGWQELATFLGYECPDILFPHENKALTAAQMIRKIVKRQYRRRLHGLVARR